MGAHKYRSIAALDHVLISCSVSNLWPVHSDVVYLCMQCRKGAELRWDVSVILNSMPHCRPAWHCKDAENAFSVFDFSLLWKCNRFACIVFIPDKKKETHTLKLIIFLIYRKCYSSLNYTILKACHQLLHFTSFVSRCQKCRQESCFSICKVTKNGVFVMPTLSMKVSIGNRLYKPLSEPPQDKTHQSGMCAQRRLRSAQSDQSLRHPHEESLGPYLPIERTAKTLIRLGGCLGWSESLLGAHSFCWFCHEAAQVVNTRSLISDRGSDRSDAEESLLCDCPVGLITYWR